MELLWLHIVKGFSLLHLHTLCIPSSNTSIVNTIWKRFTRRKCRQNGASEGAEEETVASSASGNNFVFTFAIIKLEYFRHFCLQLFTNLAVKVLLPGWENVFILNVCKSFISFFWACATIVCMSFLRVCVCGGSLCKTVVALFSFSFYCRC